MESPSLGSVHLSLTVGGEEQGAVLRVRSSKPCPRSTDTSSSRLSFPLGSGRGQSSCDQISWALGGQGPFCQSGQGGPLFLLSPPQQPGPCFVLGSGGVWLAGHSTASGRDAAAAGLLSFLLAPGPTVPLRRALLPQGPMRTFLPSLLLPHPSSLPSYSFIYSLECAAISSPPPSSLASISSAPSPREKLNPFPALGWKLPEPGGYPEKLPPGHARSLQSDSTEPCICGSRDLLAGTLTGGPCRCYTLAERASGLPRRDLG